MSVFKSLWSKIAFCVVLMLLIGFTSGMSTTSSIQGWYTTLNKPFFNPPNWIFGPMWTLLYAMMGVSIALIWDSTLYAPFKKNLYILFSAQVVLNFLWSIFFFGMENPTLALVDILILWVLILLCILKFRPISKLASNLLIPYLLWVSFATLLNIAIVVLN